jgi:threonine dehydratase
MGHHELITLEEIKAARMRIEGEVIRTPLVRLNLENTPAEIFLKLEIMQPIRAFKIRAAANLMKLIDKTQLENGVWAVSAGNWAQAVGWYARQLGVKCTIILPDSAPQIKINAINRLGAKIVKCPQDQFMEIFRTRKYEGMDGLFLHAFSDPAVMAGNGTIGLEILEDLPDVDTVLIPWGGGGLSCGISSAIRALKPDVKVYGCEVNTGAPLAASFKSGKPVEQIDYTPSFVDGIGAPTILPEMWNLAKQLLDGSLVVGLNEIVKAIRILAERNCVIAEGAGAAPVAAALAGKAGGGKIACVISGGNIDPEILGRIFQGKMP